MQAKFYKQILAPGMLHMYLLGDLPMVQPYVIPAYALTPSSSDLTIWSPPYVITYVCDTYLTPSISRLSQIAELISEYVPGLTVRYPIGL